MRFVHSVHWFQAAAEARTAVEPHAITYVDFLTVTLTAMCVLLAALGFIVAVLAVIGYRDIKASALKVATTAANTAIELKLKEYPDAAQIHEKFSAMDRYMSNILRRERLLSQIRSAPPEETDASKVEEEPPARRPRRYPKKGD